MGDYDEQIRILAEAMEAMQGGVLAAENAAAQAQQQRQEIAARLVSAERNFAAGVPSSGPRGIPIGSPRAMPSAPPMPQLVDTKNIGKVPN